MGNRLSDSGSDSDSDQCPCSVRCVPAQKVIVMGEMGAGKTSIVIRLVKDEFSESLIHFLCTK